MWNKLPRHIVNNNSIIHRTRVQLLDSLIESCTIVLINYSRNVILRKHIIIYYAYVVRLQMYFI